MSKEQEDFKRNVREWLKKTVAKDRQWLADQCGVHKRTVDNWLSSKRPIPLRVRKLIASKMRQANEPKFHLYREGVPLTEDSSVKHVLALALSSEQLYLFNKAANEEDMYILDWMIKILLNEVNTRYENIKS